MMVVTVMNADHTIVLSVVTEHVMLLKLLQIVQKTVLEVIHVQTVNLIGQITALSAVIQHGMHLVLIALP
jgi:hypothetical protein